MKILVFVFLMLFSFGYQDSISDTINGYIEQIKEAIPEPITIETLNIDLTDNEYLSGYLNISTIKLQGLKAFDMDITYVLNILPTYFVLTIDPIKLDLDYLADVSLVDLSLLHIFGEGTGSVELTNFTVAANLAVSLVPKNLTINGMQMHLDKAKFVFDGLLEDATFSNELSEFLSNNVANIFNENENALSTVVEDTLNKAIADIIANMNSTSSQAYDSIAREYVKNNYNTDIYNTEEVFQLIAETMVSVISSVLPKIY